MNVNVNVNVEYGPAERAKRFNPLAHLWWSNERVFPFFNDARPHWPDAYRQAERAGPTWGPLSLYPQIDKGRFDAISALVALPFGHFGA